MRDLGKYTYTVTGFSLCIFTCTMLKVLYYRKCIGYSCMIGFSLDIYYRTDTTIIMFKIRILQTLFIYFI